MLDSFCWKCFTCLKTTRKSHKNLQKTETEPHWSVLIEPMGKNFHSKLVLGEKRILSLLRLLLLFLQDRRTQVGAGRKSGLTWRALGTSKNQEKRERMQIKLGGEILPSAWCSAFFQVPKDEYPTCTVREQLSSQHIPQPGTEPWCRIQKSFCPRAASRAWGMRHQNSDFSINNWDETTLRSIPDLHRGGREDPFVGRFNLHPHPVEPGDLTVHKTAQNSVWVKETPKIPHKNLTNSCPASQVFLFRRSS